MSIARLTISWEEQLLKEAEHELETASAKEDLAHTVWGLALLGYAKLRGAALLDGIGAGRKEMLRGWAAYGPVPAALLQGLQTLSRYEARLGTGERLPELPMQRGTLRSMGQQLLGLLRDVKPQRDRLLGQQTGGNRDDVAVSLFL
ncbi:hypothetical protein WMW72_09330 [Paenibacillus filicis]|uniref:Uncharacterized protein n=1 Tax=Paenibacillus filicis TaxID=669464 RepID=A0ABU9DJ73_9BACL